ncbi:MAG: hypothetical protein ACPG3X_00045 [Opitutales bacterium]
MDRDAQSAKIWLEPVSLARNFGLMLMSCGKFFRSSQSTNSN